MIAPVPIETYLVAAIDSLAKPSKDELNRRSVNIFFIWNFRIFLGYVYKKQKKADLKFVTFFKSQNLSRMSNYEVRNLSKFF